MADVLKVFDSNKDGKVTLQELQEVGLDALPSFSHMGVEGHHYDVESGESRPLYTSSLIISNAEFFLHHEG